MRGRIAGSEGKLAKVDSGYFGGDIRSAHLRESHVDGHLPVNQDGKRQVVVIARERNDKFYPGHSSGPNVRPVLGSKLQNRERLSTPTKSRFCRFSPSQVRLQSRSSIAFRIAPLATGRSGRPAQAPIFANDRMPRR